MVSRELVKHHYYSPAAISSSESIDMKYTSGAAQLPRPSRSRLAALLLGSCSRSHWPVAPGMPKA